MKTQWLLRTMCGLLVVGLTNGLLADPPTIDASPTEQAAPRSEAAMPLAEEQMDVTHGAEHAAEHTRDIGFRASDLIGMSIKNKEGENLGSLKDLVFDRKTGGIRYGVLARGGLLGIGQKLVPVPWNAFELQMEEREARAFRPDDRTGAEPHTGIVSGNDVSLVLDVDARTLDEHPGFEKDNWPKSGDDSLMRPQSREVQQDLPTDRPASDRDAPAREPGVREGPLPR